MNTQNLRMGRELQSPSYPNFDTVIETFPKLSDILDFQKYRSVVRRPCSVDLQVTPGQTAGIKNCWIVNHSWKVPRLFNGGVTTLFQIIESNVELSESMPQNEICVIMAVSDIAKIVPSKSGIERVVLFSTADKIFPGWQALVANLAE